MEEMLLLTPQEAGSVEYVKTMPETDFATFEAVLADLAPQVALPKRAGFKYFVYKQGGKEIVVPTHPFGRASYNFVYAAGAIFGSESEGTVPTGQTPVVQNRKFTDVNGKEYRVRLMTGVPGNTWAPNTNIDAPNFDPIPEFDHFIHNLWILDDNTKPRINFKDLFVPESEKVAKSNYTATNSRSWAWVQGHSNTYGNVRARFDTTYPDTYVYPFKFTGFGNASAALTSTNGIWWPVFEPV